MIPQRYAHFVFGLVFSGIMSSIVVMVATIHTIESYDLLLTTWFWSWLSSWCVAFPVFLTIGPIVRRIVAKVTRPD